MTDESFDDRLLPVPEGLDGERVDVAIARLLGLSRTRVADLIAAGQVRVDGVVPAKSARLAAGSWLEVRVPRPGPPRPPVIPTPVADMAVVYDDPDIVVVDKPAGVAAHPSPGWEGATVLGALLAAGYRVATSGAAERQGIVHRLDVGTSGLMVVAKSERAYSTLKRAFREREVHKIYHALVQGHPDPVRGTIDAPIDRHPVHEFRFAVVAGGKPSVTHYTTLEALPAASLLEIELETGRTHQIRVHMAAIRHPCVGDLMYGADPTFAARLGLDRQWLHAVRLRFTHPILGSPIELTSSYPPDLDRALRIVRQAA
ncbi:ribosomal large subunit pseudouridine synthase D [Acidothermus cellulolyticus 11B]|uniref:Pseudouridine synthase n=1 Tax=Acidothermus cellulolyticus (strain ATCC 43068 / DSM 8971 / 11B) TaxID=351607 RepID=A0LTP5_ACIC1|nr:RluA family pseudouridine synthase [Acidothermus cellulolyticus]ABK52805.1 ribosomal large subunit pseudouridine synthase D [Acidothermus cellulolyticus 11B]